VTQEAEAFPLGTVNFDLLRRADHRTTCPWKGVARYYDVSVDGETNANAAWSYPDPSSAAREIKDHIALWHGVNVETWTCECPPAAAGAGRLAIGHT
jgi:uncharacterized protein (DUF427 family)